MRRVLLCLVLFVVSVQAAFVSPPLRARSRRAACRMTSVGDVWSGIEHMTRLLDENKRATTGVLIRQKQLLSRPVPGSTREQQWLHARFSKLTEREQELHAELQRLVVIALLHQINGGDGMP